MKNILLIIFFLIATSNVALSQIDSEVLISANGKYYFQGNVYSSKDLPSLLEVDPKAFEVYKDYLRKKTGANVLGITSLIGIATGVRLINTDEGDQGNCDGLCKQGKIGFLVFMGGIAAGVVGTTTFINSKITLKKSLKTFNNNRTSPAIGVAPMELNLKTTNHGVGLVLNF